SMLARFEAQARARQAERAFLEVAADNRAALALYRAAGWAEAARRAGYYTRAGALPEDALLLCRDLT
ncbi:MAG: GNAT family N-acetyltransferase, partial [Paracoccaceae bacterium]